MNLEESIIKLKQGGVLLYPTDTIWGIGCDATDENACQKISEIKNRPSEKSFIILVDGFPMLERFIPDFPSVCYDLADFATKPLTIIYPNAKGLAPSIIADDGSVGIRITQDPICLKLIRALKKPIVSTSANISGKPFPTNYSEIEIDIKNKVDAIIEERIEEKMTTPSQIIKIGIDGSVKIIRS